MNPNTISLFRSLRRQSGLTQEDVAFLVGLKAASQVSRHESGEREPELRLALGYKLIFDATAHELLPNIFLDVAKDIAGRVHILLDRENATPNDQRSACKAEHLRKLTERIKALTEEI